MVLGSDRMSRSCGIELCEAKEVAIKANVLISYLDLPIAKGILIKLREEFRIATFELYQRAQGLTSIA